MVDLPGWATVLGTAIGIAGVLLAVGRTSSLTYVMILGFLRAQFLGRVLRGMYTIHETPRWARSAPFWWRFWRQTWTLLQARVRACQAPLPVDEFAWISQTLDLRGTEHAGTLHREVPVPLAFSDGYEDSRRKELDRVARAYERYAVSLTWGWLGRIAAGPTPNDERACALKTAGQLEAMSHRHQTIPPRHPDWPDRVELRTAATGIEGGHETVRLLAWPSARLGRSDGVFSEVSTSYTPFRVIRPGTAGAKSLRSRTPLVVPLLEGERLPDGDRYFDGVLTRLHGDPGFRVEIDQRSSHQSLHLSISETSYFAVVATQWSESAPELRGELNRSARLLSLNLLLEDGYGKVILVQRNQATNHPGGFAGAVSGTCELVERAGIAHADIDEDGFPDPMSALVRETREELGIDVSAPQAGLRALGLIEVETEHDLGTSVLVATARLPIRAEQFRVRLEDTDEVEGAWELGDETMVVDLGQVERDNAQLREFVHWLRATKSLLPHGVGSLLLLLIANLQKPGRPEGSLSVAHLAAALTDLLPAASDRQPATVSFQAFWATPGDEGDR